MARGVDLLRLQPENEHVVPQHLLRNLDVGTVEGADDHAAVHDELHVGRAARLHAGGGDVLGARDVWRVMWEVRGDV